MSKKLMKACALAVAGGMLFQLGGCLSGAFLRQAAVAVAGGVAADFLTDNETVFDLFQDDFGTATTFDDRNLAEPSREEPEEA